MGYNTTVVVLNDALSDIANDPGFGARLAYAIKAEGPDQSNRSPVTVPAYAGSRCFANAAVIVESHHADDRVLVRVGGDTGELVDSNNGLSKYVAFATVFLSSYGLSYRYSCSALAAMLASISF